MTTATTRRARRRREALIMPGLFAFIIVSGAMVNYWPPLGIIPAAIIIAIAVKVCR